MRQDYLSWNDYFMGIAKLSAMRSKDPSTQVGACIVDRSNKIVSMGYNGMPYGIEDKEAKWDREGKWEETKYPYVCHAELNAILNSPRSVKDCRIFVTHHPCNECSKAIVQSGITEVIKAEGEVENSASIVLDSMTLSLPLDDLIDYNKELERLHVEIESTISEIKRAEGKLNNVGFTSKAPEKLVLAEKEKLEKHNDILKELKEKLAVVKTKVSDEKR